MLEVSWFVCGMLYFLLYCYLFSKLARIPNKFDKKNLIKIILFSFGLGMINGLFQSGKYYYLRPYFIHIYTFIGFIFIYHQKFIKTLIGILGCIIICCLSEFFFGFLSVVVFNADIVKFNNYWLGYLISNIGILLLNIVISKLSLTKKIFTNIFEWYNENELKTLFLFAFTSMTIIDIFLYNNFKAFLPSSILWWTNLLFIGVILFIIGFFKEKSNNNRIIAEYDQLLEYVKNYEKLIETKSKNQHEYKNQLILIQGMIKNKEAISYIDELLKNEKEDQNVELLKKLQYLPQGGLKGLIYYKIEKMIDKKIDVYVDIASNLKNTKVLKDNLQDISKIIGVYLDNAIEAVEKADKKYIIIESYIEDVNIVFSFSNTYKGNIDLNKVDKEGYTTKGEGKGYGLSLVRDIIEKNNKFSQKRELNGIYYVQKLYIKK